MFREPKELILAAMRLEDAGNFLSSVEAGNTDKSAPVSTRKERPESSSITDKEPALESIEEIWEELELPGVSPSRRECFPTEES